MNKLQLYNSPHEVGVRILFILDICNKRNLKNEDVEKSVKAQFFYNLAQIGKHKQVIIFDNEIPPKDLSDITYHHFTGNQMIYRTGFIPQNI